MDEEYTPFYLPRNIYLKPVYRLSIIIHLPKLRPLNQSISNWEIRERLRKMLKPIQLDDFRVVESGVEEVKFAVSLRTLADVQHVNSILDNVTFRAIGFMDPLSITVQRTKSDFPVRVDWDKFFHGNRNTMNEREPGQRPDTIYVGGIPFAWFGSNNNAELEKIIKRIFTEYGEITSIDIPQSDPYRRKMDSDISGLRLASFNYGEELFFEIYVQFKEYNGFAKAMASLDGKVMVRRGPKGEENEAKFKLDFDRMAHLSIQKITQRAVKRACIEYETEIMEEERRRDEVEKEEFARRLMRLKKRKDFKKQKGYEHTLRKKLEDKLVRKLRQIKSDRKNGAETLLSYVAKLYKEKRQEQHSSVQIFDLASEYVKEKGLPPEDVLRERMIKKAELRLRTRLTERLLVKNSCVKIVPSRSTSTIPQRTRHVASSKRTSHRDENWTREYDFEPCAD